MTKDYNLAEKSKEELAELINKLLNSLPEKERIEFLSQWISPQAALSEAYAGDSYNFLMRVERFCKDCLMKNTMLRQIMKIIAIMIIQIMMIR